MSDHRERAWFIVAVLVAVSASIYFLSDLILNAGHMVIALGGDSSMTYHAYLYHVLYEKGVWTNCMNYPYGDNIIFKGSLPLLSIPLSYLQGMVPVSIETALAILHLSIAFSYVLGMLYTYKVLRLFCVSYSVSIIFSVLIICMSPQVFRLLGHFGLTYPCVIPMLFYWSLQYFSTGHWRYPIYVFVLGLLMSFSHLYFGAIIFMWVMFYTLGYFVFVRRPLLHKVRHTGLLFVSVLLLFIVLKVFMVMTDPVKDRPSFQSGAKENITYRTQLTTSAHSPFWMAIQKKWPGVDISRDNDEGYSYLGIVTIAVLLISLLRGIFLYFKRKNELVVADRNFQPIWLFIAFCGLALAMDVPFRLRIEWLFNYTGIFKQFRSLGRFSWQFYYIATIYSVVVLYGWFSRLLAARKQFIAYTGLIVAMLIWGAEANGYALFIRERNYAGPYYYKYYFSKRDPQTWSEFLADHDKKGLDFQGIISVNFSNIGTEKLYIGDSISDWRMMLAGIASLQLHLPIVNAFIARESWSQAEAQVRLVAGPFADKPILKLKDRRPYLLLRFEKDSLDPDSKYLLQAADYIGHINQCDVYAFYPERMLNCDRRQADSVRAIIGHMTNRDTCIGTNATWFAMHFDSSNGDHHFFGTGAANVMHCSDTLLATVPMTTAAQGQLYEFSCWFLLSNTNANYPIVFCESLDSAGNEIQYKDVQARESVDNSGLWFRASLYFNIDPGCKYMRLRLHNQPDPSYIAIDELLFRPAKSLMIFKDNNGNVLVNNHLFAK